MIGAIKTQYGDLAPSLVVDRHVHRGGFSPEREQVAIPPRQFICCTAPAGSIDRGAWPRPMFRRLAALLHEIGQLRHIQIILSEKAGHVLEPGNERRREIDAGNENE
jgi:hypothetical protein